MYRKFFSGMMVLALLMGMFGASAPAPFAPRAVQAAPSGWCVAGSFNGWNNASDPLYDDGTHGDLIPEDDVFSLEYTVAAAGRYEWKVVKCGDWGVAYPANNAWFNTDQANQSVTFTFDANDYSGDAGAVLLPAQHIVNAMDTLPTGFTAVGDFQGWNNTDPATALVEVGPGIYHLAYQIPTAGTYEGKVVVTDSWDAFGTDGRNTNAPNLNFTTTADNETVAFLLDANTGRLIITPQGSGVGNWCLAGDFNGWDNASTPLYDDGANGDLIGGDGVFSLDYTVAEAGDYGWKIVACGGWDTAYPAANAWVSTSEANQVVKFIFDTNDRSADAGWELLPTQHIVNAWGDVPAGFTAVGSFQGWNNADPATALAAAGGGLYVLAYPIPTPGDHIGKITTTGSWNAFGADGRSTDAANVEFTTTAPNQTAYFLLDVLSGRVLIKVLMSPEQDNYVMWDGLEHDSRNDLYRQPFGAVTTGTPITLRFRTYANDVTAVRVRLWDTKLGQQQIAAMSKVATIPGDPFDYDIWELNLIAPDHLTVLYYRFIVTDGTDTDYYEDSDLYDGGLGRPYNESPDRSWQINVYDPDFTVPDWFKHAVVYQIFPDRFRNGLTTNDPISGTFFYDEDPGVLTAPHWNWIVPDPRVAGPWEGSYSKLFYGGDLYGIIEKLDYLHDLGVNTLYLNPIFESPSNHKYDTTDFSVIDANFGDLTTFLTLTQELQDRGMYLILDGVFNHTSSDSHYFDRYGRYDDFVGACESVDSPYRDWYYFRPATPAGTGPCDGDTTYEAWWGFDSLPKLNTTDVPEVRSFIYSDTNAIARYWLEQGADGWRLDVAGDVHPSFWRDWRDHIRDAKDTAITIAEEWGDASHFMLGDQLDSTMNYRFRNAVIGVLRETDWQDTNSLIRALSLSEFDSVMRGIEEDYPAEAFYAMMNLVGGHDVNRVLIPLDQDGDPTDDDYSDGKMRQKMLALIQMTMPGAPTIYYGDEVGLVGYGDEGGGGIFYSDPYNRQPYPWPDEDGYNDLPAWRQRDLDMLAHYSTAAAIRHANAALRTGSFDTLLVDDDAGIYAYGRGRAAVIGLNFGTTQTLTIPVAGYLPDGTTLTDALNGGDYTVVNGEIVILDMGAMWGAILIADEHQPLDPPDAPTGLEAVEGNGEVALTWDAVTGATAYAVYRSYVYGGGYAKIGESAVTSFVDDTVMNGTLYYYVVTALDIHGNESARSNEVSALPHVTIDWANLQWPHEFTHTIGITPTQEIYGQVYIDGVTSEPGPTPGLLAQVGFGASMTNFTGWTMWVDAVYNGDVGNNDEFMAQLLPEETGDFYYLYRYSTTAGRDWVYAGTTGTAMMPVPGVMHVLPAADTTPPPVPLNLRVIHWGTDHITVQWDPVDADDLAGYDLYRYAEGDAPEQSAFLARVWAPTTIYTDTDVVVDTTYTYTVQAFDTSLNKSPFSNPASGTAAAREVEVRFRVTVPPFTPVGDTIFIPGDNAAYLGAFWNPGAQPITRLDATTWAYTVTIPEETSLQYKFTRGSWDVVENWGDLVGEANRHLTVAYGDDGIMLVEDVVYNWRDPLVVEHYPAAGAPTWDTATPIWALISRPIDPTRVTTATFVVEQAGDGVVPGMLAVQATTFDPYPDTAVLPYLTGSLVVFTPTTALNLNQEYTVTLIASGYREEVDMRANYTWTFGGPPPALYLPLVMRSYTP